MYGVQVGVSVLRCPQYMYTAVLLVTTCNAYVAYVVVCQYRAQLPALCWTKFFFKKFVIGWDYGLTGFLLPRIQNFHNLRPMRYFFDCFFTSLFFRLGWNSISGICFSVYGQ